MESKSTPPQLSPHSPEVKPARRRVVSLDGIWRVLAVEEFSEQYPKDDNWLEMTLPSHWQEHPELESYSGKVVYKKTFSFRKRPGRRYWLKLHGIFYFSHVRLNSQRLGSHEGYFFPQEYEITGVLGARNTLLVEVDCPDEKIKTGKRMITGVFSHWDCLDPETNPGGIWLPVEIIETGSVHIKEMLLQTQKIDTGKAMVWGRMLINSAQTQEVQVAVNFQPHNFQGARQKFHQMAALNAGENEIDLQFEILEPIVWWTHDLGDPNLYRVTVDALGGEHSDRWEDLFGLRLFEMRDWIGYLNGKRLFLKGNNYPPGDARMARMTYEAYQRDLALAKEAHFNMLRVHAHVEHPAFYRAADEAGILLWQDFPLQWLYYKQVLSQATSQIEKMVRLLFNHPAIVIWCMHNEPAWTDQSSDERLGNILRGYLSTFIYSWNREVMDSRLKRMVEGLDTSRFVVRSSGEWPVPLLREGTDSHFYFGWYRSHGPLKRWAWVRKRLRKALRFVTEFGAQSFPNYESCLRFMDPDLSRLDWQHLGERHSLQREIMDRWLNLTAIKTLHELVDKSQDYQIKINQYYIDRLRYHKYRPTGGVLAFLFLDPNPAVQWSVVDYWRVPKRSYFALQRSFHPQYVFTLLDALPYAVDQPINLPIYMVNDSHLAYGPVRITAQVLEPDGRAPISASFAAKMEADSQAVRIGEINLRFHSPGKRLLRLTLAYGQKTFQNEYLLEAQKHLGRG